MKKRKKKKAVRKFDTGAFRDNDTQKLNYIGSFSPLVLKRFAEYMRNHNIKDGKLQRTEGNWKKGMPIQSYMESKARHFVEGWIEYEGYGNDDIEILLDLLCAEMFNVMGHIHTILVGQLKNKSTIHFTAAEKRKIMCAETYEEIEKIIAKKEKRNDLCDANNFRTGFCSKY